MINAFKLEFDRATGQHHFVTLIWCFCDLSQVLLWALWQLPSRLVRSWSSCFCRQGCGPLVSPTSTGAVLGFREGRFLDRSDLCNIESRSQKISSGTTEAGPQSFTWWRSSELVKSVESNFEFISSRCWQCRPVKLGESFGRRRTIVGGGSYNDWFGQAGLGLISQSQRVEWPDAGCCSWAIAWPHVGPTTCFCWR